MEAKQIGNLTIVSSRKKVKGSDLGPYISSAAISLLVYLGEIGMKPDGPGFTIHYQHGDECDVEVCVPVSTAGKPRGEINFRDVPGGNAFSKVIPGPYVFFSPSSTLLAGECPDAPSEASSPKEIRLVYLQGPQQAVKDSNDWKTELLYLL